VHGFPFTVTRPAAINSSAPRRDAIPVAARKRFRRTCCLLKR